MKLKYLLSIIFFYSAHNAFAWSDHSFTTYYALQNTASHKLQEEIKPETLQNFLIDMQKNHPAELKIAITNAEQWAIQNMPGYHPIPTNIFYNENNATNNNIVEKFLYGIRVNPSIYLTPYVRSLPMPDKLGLWKKENEISYKVTKLPAIEDAYVPDLHYFKISPTQTIPALVVLSTAADIPDLGLDINLFEDNNTNFGKIYGFGKLPFGDKRTSFSSSPPFHYGAYHEWNVLYKLAPQTLDCYAEYRAKLYRELARVAFATHHDYWGWMFLGLGLHYVQDVSQPYHSHFFPGYNTAAIISYYALSLVRIEKPLTNSIHLVANRHFLLEDFVLKLLQNPSMSQSAELQNALKQIPTQENNLQYNDEYTRQVVSLKAMRYADQLSQSLVNNFLNTFVNDPNFLYVDKQQNILKTFQSLKPQQQNDVLETLKPILQYTGIYTRVYLKDFL